MNKKSQIPDHTNILPGFGGSRTGAWAAGRLRGADLPAKMRCQGLCLALTNNIHNLLHTA